MAPYSIEKLRDKGGNKMNTTNGNGLAVSQEEVRPLPIMVSLMIGIFLAILNETLLNVAFPDLMVELSVGATTVQWLSTVFLLIMGILVPISALLIQWFTTRQMFLGAMFFFLLGTIVCAISPNFAFLLIGRIIQALGTGLMLPVLMNTVLIIIPPERRGAAMGMMGLVITFAPALGPTLSGLIVQTLDWRWLFIIIIPLTVLSIIFAAIYLKNVTPVTKPKVDIVSIIFSTLGFGGIVLGFSSAGEGHGGWAAPQVYLPVLVGIISLTYFIWRQLRLKEPLLDLRVFKYPMFTISSILLVVMMMTMFSTMILIPLYLQNALALSALTAGLVLLPGGILNGIMSPVSGRLFDKYGPKGLVLAGTVLLVIDLLLFTQLTETTHPSFVVTLHCILMLAISLVMMPAQTNGLNELSKEDYPHGSAIMNTLMQISGAIGTALFITIMSNRQAAFLEEKAAGAEPAPALLAESLTSGVQTAFTVGLGFAVASFVIGFFVKRVKATQNSVSHH
jgi:DHA2 family lincomycin resistance protein-like MFS transporter